MASFVVEDFFKPCADWSVLTRFVGSIDERVVNDALHRVDVRLEEEEFPLKFCKRVYNILVEVLQNLHHHADCMPLDVRQSLPRDNSSYAAFCVGFQPGSCKVITGNFVHKDAVPALTARLNKLNVMDAEELRSFYREVLNNQVYSKKGGGGLGLIDIARKSKNSLDYSFQQIDEEYFFYTLLVTISS